MGKAECPALNRAAGCLQDCQCAQTCLRSDGSSAWLCISTNFKGNKRALISQRCKCLQASHPERFPSLENSVSNASLVTVTLVHRLRSRENVPGRGCVMEPACVHEQIRTGPYPEQHGDRQPCPSHGELMVTPCSMLLPKAQEGCTQHLTPGEHRFRQLFKGDN